MNATAYQLLATIAKYWFLALMVMILLRLTLSVAREMRIERQVRREIERAGTGVSATLELVADENKRLKRSKRFAIEGECTVGRGRQCDVRVRSRSLERVHCILAMGPKGLEVAPVGRAFVMVDGAVAARRAIARDGSVLQMGGLIFRLEMEERDEV